MAEIWVMGEMLVEIMRDQVDVGFKQPGVFRGPYPSGAPAIFIDTVARLGHSAGIISGVGADDFGELLTARLERDRVDVSQVLKESGNATGCAFVSYFADGSRKFIYHIGNTPAVMAKAPAAQVLQEGRYFHVMGCSLYANISFAEEILKAVKMAKHAGAKISFDPNIRPELMGDKRIDAITREILKETNIFMPGTGELKLLTGKDSVAAAVAECFRYPEMEIVALKKGSRGCTVYTASEEYSCGVYRVTEQDPTGAGDSFDGAFIAALAEGLGIPEAMKWAAAAGALNAAAFGPMEGQISRAAIAEMIKEETV